MKWLTFLLIFFLTGCSEPIHSFYVASCRPDGNSGAHVMANMPSGGDVAASECVPDVQAQKIADDLNRTLWANRASR